MEKVVTVTRNNNCFFTKFSNSKLVAVEKCINKDFGYGCRQCNHATNLNCQLAINERIFYWKY